DTLEQYMPGHKYERKVSFQLWTKGEGLILRSTSAPAFSLSNSAHGFSQTLIGEHLWHVFSLSDSNGEYVIHVGQRDDIRRELTDDISKRLVKPFLIGIPLLGIVIWFIIGRSLSSIDRLATEITKRKADRLEPLPTKRLPSEILPLVNAQNNLFAQLAQAFENERRFTSNASHELRTPLAGLLSQAQVAIKTEDDKIRRQALSRIEQGVKRMSHMVRQLLTLSRLAPNVTVIDKRPTDLKYAVVQVINDLSPFARSKGIVLEFYDDAPRIIYANPELLDILIRNIVNNAIQYTPVSGRIKISIEATASFVHFRTEDTGPGIPEELHDRVLQRFYRIVDTAQAAQGSGLGLSIVDQIAKIHGADIKMQRSQHLGGLEMLVKFPQIKG
ncbi:MAG: ATP-binding protein, partial [Gammaproteobacteria bacterium]